MPVAGDKRSHSPSEKEPSESVPETSKGLSNASNGNGGWTSVTSSSRKKQKKEKKKQAHAEEIDEAVRWTSRYVLSFKAEKIAYRSQRAKLLHLFFSLRLLGSVMAVKLALL